MPLENWKNPKKKKRKLPRILVEWICSECDQVHRISIPYTIRYSGIKVEMRGAKNVIKKLELDADSTLTELNEFLNSLFFQYFHAINYVKIRYPERLFKRLQENELLAQKRKRF